MQAHQEAEHIIAQAQAEAIQINRDAKKQADMLYERTKLEAYRDGVSKLQDEILAKTDELNTRYKEKEEALWAEYEEKLDELETNMVDVMIQVFNKVFHIQFDNKRQILLQLIKDTLLGVDAGKEFVIRVSEANYKYVESHVADIKEKIGNDVTIDVVNDMTIDEEACIIETATGVYDCGIDMVMTNLEKDIRSLCR
jgi:flagellar assembly protein FliH